MIHEERLLKVIVAPHVSEKSSALMKKSNTIILQVEKNYTKEEIKAAVQKIFEVQVESVTTLVVKGKRKRRGTRLSKRKNWKKAYITLKKGHNVDFIIKKSNS